MLLRIVRAKHAFPLRRLAAFRPLGSAGSFAAPARYARCAAFSAAVPCRSKSDAAQISSVFAPTDAFPPRHIGPEDAQIAQMCAAVGASDLLDLVSKVVPQSIHIAHPTLLGRGLSESEAAEEIRRIADRNKICKSLIGMGYVASVTPPVILRNILENPRWYTQYTPYQPEISQGRLESLLNYQTMVRDLTGLDIANASLLDEGTAAAEAMLLSFSNANRRKNIFFVDKECFPQTIACVQTRAQGFGIQVVVGDFATFDFDAHKDQIFGALIQYPNQLGNIVDYEAFVKKAHDHGALVSCATDLLALTVLKPPAEFGVDIALGNSQRFGVPMGYGGPHAAFFAVRDALKRRMPGRLVGVSKDVSGENAYRLTLQTREQHIRREKATSNICTAQALLANMAAMYAVYHGSEGLVEIAKRVHNLTVVLATAIQKLGHEIVHDSYFDTLLVKTSCPAPEIIDSALQKNINLRLVDDKHVGITLDETVTKENLIDLVNVFATGSVSYRFQHSRNPLSESAISALSLDEIAESAKITSASPARAYSDKFVRTSRFLTHPVFSSYHSETMMLRYITALQNKDLSLADAMIPLGSCTMKLNATTEMLPVSFPEFANIHPFAPRDQAAGYKSLIDELEYALSQATGFENISLQPNSGAQGEYAGLRVIKAYLDSIGQGHRDVCLIPVSAHGTNPASAAMCGMTVVPIECDKEGNLDLVDLRAKSEKHKDRLAATMITYPSTYGLFEEGIREACEIVHSHGGLVYMDGANLNAQMGLCKPAEIGADVCHLNLHKTFCIPHGGGGPGMGPIGVKSHLAPFLPTHPVVPCNDSPQAIGPISAAPWGSASILPISWAYLKMMGDDGLRKATQVALLNANYLLRRLSSSYEILYTSKTGFCAHEFIIDCRPFDATAGIGAVDIAKRLIDYGFHSPTMSFPVANTLMIEPTESEPLEELDRFVDAMLNIRREIQDIESGKQPRDNNVLVNAPHTIRDVVCGKWDRPYTFEQAVFPVKSLKNRKFWPTVGRVDDVYGDRNLVCSCPPLSDYVEEDPSESKKSN